MTEQSETPSLERGKIAEEIHNYLEIASFQGLDQRINAGIKNVGEFLSKFDDERAYNFLRASITTITTMGGALMEKAGVAPRFATLVGTGAGLAMTKGLETIGNRVLKPSAT